MPKAPPPLAPSDGLSIWRRGEGRSMQRGSCRTSCGLNTGGNWSVLAQPGEGTESLIDRGAPRAPYACKALELHPKSHRFRRYCIYSLECKHTARLSLPGVEAYPPPGSALACNAHGRHSNCYACHTIIPDFLNPHPSTCSAFLFLIVMTACCISSPYNSDP